MADWYRAQANAGFLRLDSCRGRYPPTEPDPVTVGAPVALRPGRIPANAVMADGDALPLRAAGACISHLSTGRGRSGSGNSGSLTIADTAPPSEELKQVLHDLIAVEQLKTVFNEDNGQIRLLLILSPT